MHLGPDMPLPPLFSAPPSIMYPSKQDRILSRYRPIAPKPSPFPPPSPFPSSTNDPSSTCASLDSLASSGKCSRRSRKRRAPAAAVRPSSRPKASRPGFLVVPAGSGSSFSAAAGRPASCLHQATSDGAVPSQSLPSSGDVCADLPGPHFDRSFAADPGMHDAVSARDVKWGVYPFSPQNIAHPAGMVHNSVVRECQNGLIPAFLDATDEDTGFMERAAASKVIPDKAVSPGCGSSNKACGIPGPAGFTEMIRGITRLPTVADVQSLMQGRVTAMSGSATLRTSPMGSPAKDIQRTQSVSPQHLASAAGMPVPSWLARIPSPLPGCEASLLKPVNVQYCKSSWFSNSQHTEAVHDSNESGVVTLSLLPAAPSRSISPTTETSLNSCTSAAMSHLGQQPMMGDEGITGCTSCAKQPSMMDGSSIDLAYLEQVYGASTDSVLLLDETNRVLWSNRAYERASKCSSERISHNDSVSGPYIDPLGHPTPLGSFNLHWSGKVSKVTLWGFLKKLVVNEPELSGGCRGSSSCTQARVLEPPVAMDSSNELSLRLGENPEALTSYRSLNGHMQTTLYRPRVSTATLECITDLHPQSSPMMESLEVVEERLASGNPAFITDSMCRVKWTNLALMRTLGLTENILAGSISPSDVLEVYAAEKPPDAVSAFSGRVNLEWVKAGKRRSMTLPCDVCLLASSSPGMWVWKLDISASLGLSCAPH